MLTPPPISAMPHADLGLIFGAVALVLGLVLLLAGRIVDRAVLALAGASLGAALAGPLATAWAVNWMLLSIPSAVLLAVVFVLSGRVLWALTAAGLLACMGSLVVAVAYWPVLEPTLSQELAIEQPANQQAANQQAQPAQPTSAGATTQPSMQDWARQAGHLAQRTMANLWKHEPAMMIWTLCLAGGGPLTISVLLPRLARIVMTSFLGSLTCVSGSVLLLSALRPQAWPTRWALVAIWLMLAVVLMVAGIIHQYYRAMSAAVPAKAPAAPPKPPPKTGPK